MNQSNKPIQLHAIHGAFREVDLTPPAWGFPPRGEVEGFMNIMRDVFPDAVDFTIGTQRVSVKLLAVQEFPTEHVEARRKHAVGRLFALDQQRSRERALDDGTLERERARSIEVAKRAMLAVGSSATFEHQKAPQSIADELRGHLSKLAPPELELWVPDPVPERA